MKFDTLESKTIYRGRVFSLRLDQVRMPNGNQTQVDIIDHPPAVTLVPVDAENNIWFIRQYRHPIGGEILELPAGVIEANEPPDECARREIREETGMSAGNIQPIGAFYQVPGYSTEYLYIYLAWDLKPDPLPGDEDEFICRTHPHRQGLPDGRKWGNPGFKNIGGAAARRAASKGQNPSRSGLKRVSAGGLVCSWRLVAGGQVALFSRSMLTSFGMEDGVEPLDGAWIILSPAAHIAHPGRKVRHRYQFIIQPGKIGDVPQVKHTRLAFRAGRNGLFRFGWTLFIHIAIIRQQWLLFQ